MSSIYTELEIVARIKEIDQTISEISKRPASTSIPGFSAHYMGRLTDLRQERIVWQDRRKVAISEESGFSSMQGPKLSLK